MYQINHAMNAWLNTYLITYYYNGERETNESENDKGKEKEIPSLHFKLHFL
jgi:hypothetical protein